MPNPNITPRPENLTMRGMGRKKLGRKRCEITLPPELIEKIDNYADEKKLTRGQAIETLCKKGLNDQAKPNSPV
jgi:hypothetical protein